MDSLKDFSLYRIEITKSIRFNWYKKRLQQRGYNQSTEISRTLSQILKTRMNQSILIRKRHTKTQTKLNIQQRIQNVDDAFAIKDKISISGKTILLLDDVITTGSTINSCAKQLKLNGAKFVYVVSAAKAWWVFGLSERCIL